MAKLVDKMNDLMRSDRHVTMQMMAVILGDIVGTVSTIPHDRLVFGKDVHSVG